MRTHVGNKKLEDHRFENLPWSDVLMEIVRREGKSDWELLKKILVGKICTFPSCLITIDYLRNNIANESHRTIELEKTLFVKALELVESVPYESLFNRYRTLWIFCFKYEHFKEAAGISEKVAELEFADDFIEFLDEVTKDPRAYIFQGKSLPLLGKYRGCIYLCKSLIKRKQ